MDELSIINHRLSIIILAAAAIAAAGLGRTLVVLAADGPVAAHFGARASDPNCVPHPADPNALPFKIDLARVVGTLLLPVTAPAGKWSHVFRPCDPQGDPFDVTLEQSPPSFGLTADDAAGTLTLAGDLPRGETYIYLRLVDQPGTAADPCEAVYTFVVRGSPRKNVPPVLY